MVLFQTLLIISSPWVYKWQLDWLPTVVKQIFLPKKGFVSLGPLHLKHMDSYPNWDGFAFNSVLRFSPFSFRAVWERFSLWNMGIKGKFILLFLQWKKESFWNPSSAFVTHFPRTLGSRPKLRRMLILPHLLFAHVLPTERRKQNEGKQNESGNSLCPVRLGCVQLLAEGQALLAPHFPVKNHLLVGRLSEKSSKATSGAFCSRGQLTSLLLFFLFEAAYSVASPFLPVELGREIFSLFPATKLIAGARDISCPS